MTGLSRRAFVLPRRAAGALPSAMMRRFASGVLVLSACSFTAPGGAAQAPPADTSQGPSDAPDDPVLPDAAAIPPDAPPGCTNITLEAVKSYSASTNTPGTHDLGTTPKRFQIPFNIPVVDGNAGNHCASLVYKTPDNRTVRCRFRGGASVSHVGTDVLQYALGLNYIFDRCTEGAACPTSNGTNVDVGFQRIVDAKETLTLAVDNGDSDLDPTTIRVTIAVCPI